MSNMIEMEYAPLLEASAWRKATDEASRRAQGNWAALVARDKDAHEIVKVDTLNTTLSVNEPQTA